MKIDPYRLMFPIGTLFAIWGVLLWLFYTKIPGFSYPGPAHSRMMIGGFLFSYIVGFLMTAIPRMTSSHKARPFEIAIAAFAVFLIGVLSFFPQMSLFAGSLFLGFVLLLTFCASRFVKRQKPAPQFFVFVGSGLLAGTLGSLILFLSSVGFFDGLGARLGSILIFQIMPISLVMGIGCRLVPVISGLQPVEGHRGHFIACCTALWTSAIAETMNFSRTGFLLRAFVVTSVAIFGWQLFLKPQTKSRLSYLIKASAFFVLAGLWMALLQPAYAIHWMHLTYVGGFGLMTFTVASRVTLAHGGFDLSLEANSRSVVAMGILVLLASATRVSAPFVPNGFVSHLHYAAYVWIAGVGIWSWVFVRRMIVPYDVKKSSC